MQLCRFAESHEKISLITEVKGDELAKVGMIFEKATKVGWNVDERLLRTALFCGIWIEDRQVTLQGGIATERDGIKLRLETPYTEYVLSDSAKDLLEIKLREAGYLFEVETPDENISFKITGRIDDGSVEYDEVSKILNEIFGNPTQFDPTQVYRLALKN